MAGGAWTECADGWAQCGAPDRTRSHGGLDAAAGAAVGFLVRSQATALVVVLGWAFLAEGIVAGLFIDAKPWLPITGAAQAMLSGPAEHLFTPVAGGLLLAAYALALTAFAAVALQRRDVG